MVAPLKLRTLLSATPRSMALRNGEVNSPLFELDIDPVEPVTDGFPAMVRDVSYDFGELALATFLQAREAGVPLLLLPAVLVGQFLHDTIVYNAERGDISVDGLEGKRVGIRSYTQTTGAWMRGILEEQYGVDIARVQWVCFQDPHVISYAEPSFVERPPPPKTLLGMLLDGEIDAAIGVGPQAANYPQLRTVIRDPKADALAWRAKTGAVPINHMAVVKASLYESRPDVVVALFDALARSKAAANEAVDLTPFGLEANRKSLDILIRYAARQQLIPHAYPADELFLPALSRLG